MGKEGRSELVIVRSYTWWAGAIPVGRTDHSTESLWEPVCFWRFLFSPDVDACESRDFRGTSVAFRLFAGGECSGVAEEKKGVREVFGKAR